jgi:hypothetical protein
VFSVFFDHLFNDEDSFAKLKGLGVLLAPIRQS